MTNTATVHGLDQEGRGVARVDDKVVFIEGALPGEVVEYEIIKRKPSYDLAQVTRVRRESASRVTPKCRFFGRCGGCSLQHMDPAAQVINKQRVFEEQLARIGNVHAAQLLPPIYGPFWGYRHRARLSVRYVRKKGKMLVGFHEKRSSYVADMDDCQILPRAFADLMPALAELLLQLSIYERVPQIELLIDTRGIALVLRHLEPLSDEDLAKLAAFAQQHDILWFLQPGGPATIHAFPAETARRIFYRIPDFGLDMTFSPTEFTQVNPAINQMLIRVAMRMLAVQKDDTVADFFCGLGNFTLPIASFGARVIGFEGSQALVDRLRENALNNPVAGCCEGVVQNLFEVDERFFAQYPTFDKALIDPPREGALELVKSIPDTGLNRIVYVSCNPATFARDAGILVHQKGYQLVKAGVVNMFPHTSHCESIALFERAHPQ